MYSVVVVKPVPYCDVCL